MRAGSAGGCWRGATAPGCTPAPGRSRPSSPRSRSETALLCAQGLSPADALRAEIAIGRYVVGWVLEEQAEAADAGEREGERMSTAELAGYPRLAEGMAAVRDADPDAEFDYGLGLLLDGIAAKMRG